MKRKNLWLVFLICVCVAAFAFGLVACGDDTPKDPTLTGIEITTAPDRTAYTEGDTFDPTGMVVKAKYDDDSLVEVKDYTYSPNGALKTTDTAVVVSYQGKTAEQKITVAAKSEVVRIEITKMPDKVKYFTGDTFDRTGMEVTAHFEDGSKEVVSEYAVNRTVLDAAGEIRIVVTYEGLTANFTVTVADPALTGLEIAALPSRVLYNVGETFDPAGMKVMAVYENGKTTQLAADQYVYDHADEPLAVTVEKITVSYTEGGVTKTAEVEITVTQLEITAIIVQEGPKTTEYSVGDTFNAEGLVIYGVYNDDEELVRPIEGWEILEEGKALAETDTFVTVKWETFTVKVPVTVLPNYRFEAEALGYIAKEGVDAKLKRGMEYGSVAYGATAENVAWDLVSGTGFLNNYSTVMALTLDVTVEKDVSVAVILNMASHSAEVGGKQYIKNILTTIAVGDKEYPVNEDAATVRSAGSLQYMDFQDVVVADKVQLKAGENTIKFYFTGHYNFDYVALRSSEKVVLTAEKTGGHSWTDWTVTDVPTAESAGEMYRYCPVCCAWEQIELPADLDDTSVYTLKESTQATVYLAGTKTYTYRGETFTVVTEEAKGNTVDNLHDFEDAKMDLSFNETYGIFNSGLDSTSGRDTHGKGAQKFNDGGGRFTWTFWSNQQATVTLAIRIARNTTRYMNPAFNMRLIVNGEYTGLDDTNYVTNQLSSGGVSYFDWVYVECGTFTVNKGENIISIEALAAPFTNVDDVKFISATQFASSDDKLVQSVQMTTAPTKTEYVAGERFDPTGMVLTATLKDGSQQQLDHYFVDYDGKLTADVTSIDIYAEGVKLTQNITVTAITAEPESLEITVQPDKLNYKEGEAFDPTGIELTVHYNDGSKAIVALEDVTIEAPETLPGGKTVVTFIYGGVSVELELNALYKNLLEAEGADLSGATYSMKAFDEHNGSSGFGQLALFNNPANKIVFDVYAEKEADVQIVIRVMATGKANVTGAYVFGTFELNGEAQTITADGGVTSPGWTEWLEVELATVHLRQGENEIALWATANNTNFDCMYLYSAETVRWADETEGKIWSEWHLGVAPTEEADGYIRRLSSHGDKEVVTLPKGTLLSDGEVYTVVSTQAATELVGASTKYSYGGYTFTARGEGPTGEAADHVFSARIEDGEGTVSSPVSNNPPKSDGSGDTKGLAVTKYGSLSYDVTLSAEATVEIIFDLAPTKGKVVDVDATCFLFIDGVQVFYGTEVSADGSKNPTYFDYADYSIASVDLTQGEHTIMFFFGGGNLGVLRSVNFKSAAEVALKNA